MTPSRRLIMLACIADNPGADPEALRREFICRVLSDHPMAACRILGQYGTLLHTRITKERTARAGQGNGGLTRDQFDPECLCPSTNLAALSCRKRPRW